MKYNPHPYQGYTTNRIIETAAVGPFLGMGTGKTISTLTAIDKLMFDSCEISKVLIIAPKRVAEEVWSAEIEKWDHVRHLRLSKVLGSANARKRALNESADIYIINRENVAWLFAYLGGVGKFDMLVIDELSSFKSSKAIRFRTLKTVRPLFKRVVGLTGTPASNSLMDLWAEVYLLDMGERLGKTITSYRERYFTAGKRNGHIVYSYELRKGDSLLGEDYYEKEIYSLISDICFSLKEEDYLQLPEKVDCDINLNLSVQKQYDKFEEEQVLKLDNAETISTANAAALVNKLLQFSNGAIYDANGKWHEVHKDKLEALEEIIEAANGKPVLIFYSYIHDKERIAKHFKGTVELKGSKEIKLWNEKKINILLAHPASAGHGLNLQAGGNIIVWFGLPWSLELYQQAIKRLHRQGQTEIVMNHRIISKGTVDERVLKILDKKASGQDALLDAVKAIIVKYKNI